MTVNTPQPIVYPNEEIKERYVTRRFLGIFRYDAVLSAESLGWKLKVYSEDFPKEVVINGILYHPLISKI